MGWGYLPREKRGVKDTTYCLAVYCEAPWPDGHGFFCLGIPPSAMERNPARKPFIHTLTDMAFWLRGKPHTSRLLRARKAGPRQDPRAIALREFLDAIERAEGLVNWYALGARQE
jgi:hypothetical protein